MSHQPSPPSIMKDRVVRVFVSSTFRDMQEERDHLVKHVFPELRRRCRERAVEFVEVDLRWGVTEEQANRGEVLPICLREIELCRPYFIGLLGERYGWVPEKIDPRLVEEQPWLAEHWEHSVTELEILHGVLRNPEMAKRSYFYFRDPAYLEGLPPERRPDFSSEGPAAQAKLVRLKDRIRESGLPLWEDYPHPQALGELILEDLWCAIDREYPAGEVPDPLDREAAEHEAFALSRAKVYIGRQEYYDRLDKHAASDDKPLVLQGESGVGKSALLANWLLAYREKHPDDFVFCHFIGATPQSTDYVDLLHRLISEIKRHTKDQEEVPAQSDKLREALPLWLAKASAWAGKEQKHLVLVLDALNQLEDRDNAPDLGWLPHYFPPPIRVILSTISGEHVTDLATRPLEAFKKRGWPTFTVAGLHPVEIRQVIPAYLSQYRKTLDARLLEHLVAAPQCANPLFLKALLEELRVFGVFEELEPRLLHYLTAPTVPALYQKILARLEADYEKERPGLVKEAMSLIWAARRGLYESELLELLETDGQHLPRAFWSPLSLALEDSLVSRGGLLGFFHDYLRQAVHARYLTTSAGEPDQEAEQNAHLRLADYFEKRDLDDRKADELPWQLHQAQAWERLQSCLTDLDLFLLLMSEAKKYELLGYWLALKKTGHDLVAPYQAALQCYQTQGPAGDDLAAKIHQVASFFHISTAYLEASALYQQALALWKKVLGPEQLEVAASLNNLAWLYYTQGRYNEAEPLYRRSLALSEKTLGEKHSHVAQSLNNLALLYYSQGRYGEAEQLYRRSLAIRRKVWGADHPDVAQSFHNLGALYEAQGCYVEAEPLYRRSMTIREKVLGPEHPDVAQSLNNLAGIYDSQGQYEKAEPLYQRSLGIWEKALGPEHPNVAVSLNNLGALYYAQGLYSKAEPLYQRALDIWEKALGLEHPDVAACLNNLGELYYSQGRYGKAESLYWRSLSIREKVLGTEHPDIGISLNSLALLYQAQGRYPEAETLYQRALALLERELGPTHLNTKVCRWNLRFLKLSKFGITFLILSGILVSYLFPWGLILGFPMLALGLYFYKLKSIWNRIRKQH
ncbi:MAG: tetratricopeptide repeat protein [Thermodesulfobacteriota bacterium]